VQAAHIDGDKAIERVRADEVEHAAVGQMVGGFGDGAGMDGVEEDDVVKGGSRE